MSTGIEWTDETWNPVVGCTKVSQGCKHCYAKTIHDMRHQAHLAGKSVAPQYAEPFETVQLMPGRLEAPLRWRKPRRVFVNSVSDLFHEDVPTDYLAQAFAVMAFARRHTFQVLTKRAGRMRALLNDPDFAVEILKYLRDLQQDHDISWVQWPLPNLWLGVSVENQETADERIPLLAETPAAVRFLSCEPLLGSVMIAGQLAHGLFDFDWVIVGGESGKGARPMHPDWARSLRDQCAVVGVPFFFKQWGEFEPITPVYDGRDEGALDGADDDHTSVVAFDGSEWCVPGTQPMQPPPGSWFVERIGKKRAGRELDGLVWDEFPGRAE